MENNITLKKNIPRGWKMLPIRSHIKLQGGNAFSTANYTKNGVPLVRIGNVGKGNFVADNFVYISKDEYESNKSVHLKEDDILMGMTGELGKIARINKIHLPAVLNQRVGRVIFKDNEVDPDFIYQTFLSNEFKSKLEKYFIGAAQKNISSNQVEGVEILFPPKTEQQRISEILKTVDEEIQKTDEIITATEKLKHGLTRQLLKPKKNWKNCKLGGIATITRGGSPRPIANYITDAPDELNWLRIGDIEPGEKYVTCTSQKIKKEGLSKTTLVNEGDFILSNSMSFGRPYIMKTKACIHDGWLAFKDINVDIISSSFLYYLLSSKSLQDIFGAIAAGSGVKNLKKESVANIAVTLPSINEQRKIAEVLSSISEKISINQKLKERLTLLKKGLMQDLLSGKVRVK